MTARPMNGRCTDDADLASTCARRFVERYGTTPDGVWSAPGRVNLIGEHTDYNAGYALPFAIDRRTAVAARRHTGHAIKVASSAFETGAEIALEALSPEMAAGWPAYPLGVAWDLVGDRCAELPGVELFIDSRVPTGSGLSSSAALECAVAVALNDLWAVERTRSDLVFAVQRAENIFVGSPTGIMDQFAALFGMADSAVFIDCKSCSGEVVPLHLRDAGLSVLVIDTKEQHSHAAGGYAQRRTSCELAASLLGISSLREIDVHGLERAASLLDEVTFRRARHIVTENERVLQSVKTLTSAGPAALGRLLDDSHRSMLDDFEISTPALDLAVHTARQAGAIGARMTGGGFGGSAIALAPRSDLESIADAVCHAFMAAGFQRPDTFPVTPSPGARRDL